MARISLYIPDDLKARMEAAGDEVNWSDAARPALIAAVAAFEHGKGGTMHTAIERLRTSRIESSAERRSLRHQGGTRLGGERCFVCRSAKPVAQTERQT